MSIRKTILSVALVGAFVAPAFASGTTYASEHGEATYSGPMPGNVTQQMPGAENRADVVREVLLARQNGTLQQGGEAAYSGPISGNGIHDMTGAKNRADVVHELLLARQNGTLQQGGEATYSGPISGVKNRADGAAASHDSVRRDPQASRQNPVTAHGYRFIGAMSTSAPRIAH